MDTIPLHSDDEWLYVLTLLPDNLEESAKATSALVRQRNVPNAAALIRLALAYAVSDLSLKDVAAWASGLGVATLTGPGLFYRLREAGRWLEQVLASTLEQEIGRAPTGIRLRVVDATVINGPGTTGTQWRAHVLVNPATGGFESVELTDNHGGEGYGRHPLERDDVVLGDRAYATARGIHAVRQASAHVIVRLNPHTLRVCDGEGRCISLLSDAENVPKVGVLEYNIQIPVPPERRNKSHKSWKLEDAIAWIPARVIASRTRTGDVIWILTTLLSEQWSPVLILILYRFRWQIELFFKRLKSLLHIDTLPSREGPTAKSWMLARFLAAALAQKLTPLAGALSPWGYELRESRIHA
jgi:hypothetical protein